MPKEISNTTFIVIKKFQPSLFIVVQEEVKKLTEIRSRYVTAVVVMLITLFEKSDTNGSAQLVELLADEDYMLAEVSLYLFSISSFC